MGLSVLNSNSTAAAHAEGQLSAPGVNIVSTYPPKLQQMCVVQNSKIIL